MQWTDQQRQVIEERNSDILVSAAAGSGKTAVLVERIISRVCDQDNPIDIDRILVVTFTKAAAAEMKDRIYRALEARASQDPDNTRLNIQTALVHNARISTIDGFCQYLVRNYFNEIGIDPSLRIAQEGELVLLRNEVMEDMLEDWYQKNDQAFLDLSDASSSRDRDDGMVEMIFSIYNHSLSYPYPVKWMSSLLKPYDAADKTELEGSEWIIRLLDYARNILLGLSAEASDLLSELKEANHPYADALASDLEIINDLLEKDTYSKWYEYFATVKFKALSRKKDPNEDPDERERYKKRRDEIKKELQSLQKELFSKKPEEILDEMQLCRPYVKMLSSLAIDYYNRFQNSKELRKIMDFSDLEHFALKILVDEKTNQPTETAIKLSEYFEEVMIDEYQDSNYLQEMILSSITRKSDGKHNYFMVGDVKQSIYRFRQARPDIFTGKYLKYQGDDKNEILVGLDRNFRSRRDVTDSVNAVFLMSMHSDMGGVEYDRNQSLTCGVSGLPDCEDKSCFCTEVMLADESDSQIDDFEGKVDYEAAMIAMRIRRLLEDGWVTDTDTASLRRVKLSDIAILHRSANSIGRTYQEVLKDYGISSTVMSTTGYFSSVEVETMLSLLRILNNPTGDIALAAVMKSPLFNFTDEEMAVIRASYPNERFYKAVRLFALEQEGEKTRAMLEQIDSWRKAVPYVSIYDLLTDILKTTGYRAYITALPEGDIRRKNIDKLLELSVSYENTSYRGLFYFVRYIERLKTYEQDMGQAEALYSSESVSILTIHKSKGLEFPIVFVAGCGQRFRNNTDSMVINPDLGVGIYAVDLKARLRINTLYRRFLSRINTLEDRGEEQRVLYVAMTRAKDKMILSGVLPDAQEVSESCDLGQQGIMSLSKRIHSKNYYGWIMPAVHKNRGLFIIDVKSVQDLVIEETAWQIKKSDRLEELYEKIDEVGEEQRNNLLKKIEFIYPHKITEDSKVKYSVSELKRKSMAQIFTDDSENLFKLEEEEAYVPMFISGKKPGITSAERGTAVHRYLECFDFKIDAYKSSYDNQLKVMLETGKITDEDASILPKYELLGFLKSDLANRMHRAAQGGNLKKEAAFVMADAPSHFMEEFEGIDDQEPILVQGIIDVFFEEDNSIILVDYKTDRVKTGEELILRYDKQMRLYADALNRTNEKKVKEIWLYSFALNKGILL